MSAAADSHAVAAEEPAKAASKSVKPGKGFRSATGESLEELVARVKKRIAEQQTVSSRRGTSAAPARGEDPGAVHLEWRPGVTWPTDLTPPVPAESPGSDGRVSLEWGAAAKEEDSRVSVDWTMAP